MTENWVANICSRKSGPKRPSSTMYKTPDCQTTSVGLKTKAYLDDLLMATEYEKLEIESRERLLQARGSTACRIYSIWILFNICVILYNSILPLF